MGEYSPDLEFDGLTPLRFGKEMREKAFLFQPGWRNMNHGSYGAHPAFLRHAQRRFQEDADRYPDEWINRIYPELSQQSRAAAADLLHAPLNNVVLVSNATTGTNTVLRNLVFEEGDKIIYFSTTYQALINTIDYITETTPAGKDLVEFTYPISDDALLELFRQKIAEVRRKGGKPKVVLFDTIVSIPGVRMPFEKMTQICKEEGILSCVDGAHGIGAIRLDLNALDPDFFVSNCHKWLHTSRSCAVFYVPIRNQHLIRTSLPTSHGFLPQTASFTLSSMSNFEVQFQDFGTFDTSAFLCIPAALHFRRVVCGGEHCVMAYCHDLVERGAHRMLEILGVGTAIMENAEGTLSKDIPMVNVRLPMHPIADPTERLVMLTWLWHYFVAKQRTRINVYFYDGAFWVRLSGQVYLELADFEWAAEVLKEVCHRVNAGEYKNLPERLRSDINKIKIEDE